MTAAEQKSNINILVSNDDGIFAEGIQTLVSWLARQYNVTVFAPDRERSAMGHALTLHKPLRLTEVPMDAPVVKAYAVAGTPSDCVKIALSAILDTPPDLVISGINHGPNLGTDVLYSGTVSAAIEGAIHDIPSIAVSLHNGNDKYADFNPTAEFIASIVPRVLATKLPPKTILNVNTPGLSLGEMAGIRLTTLGHRMYKDTYECRHDPRGGVYYWLVGEIVTQDTEPTSDVRAIYDNHIAITPIHFDMTDERLATSDALTAQYNYTGALHSWMS